MASQTISRITSNPWEVKTIKSAKKGTPEISKVRFGHRELVFISELGEWINVGLTKEKIDKSYLPTNLLETKECEAPESNKTDAGTELTRNIPRTTSGAA